MSTMPLFLADVSNTTSSSLFERNISLVISCAKLYARPGQPIEEYIQDGCIGLMKACEHFDISLGYKFSTYATYWIRRYMQKCQHRLAYSFSISEPDARIAKQIYALEKGEDIHDAKMLSERLGIAPKKFHELQGAMLPTISFDMTDSEDNPLTDIIETHLKKHDAATANQQAIERLSMLFECLDERQKRILTMRYGLFGYPQQTLEEIGKREKLSRERIRQIEAQCIKKMRNASIPN